MPSYDLVPCSIHISNQTVEQPIHHQPQVIEDISDSTPQKLQPREEVQAPAATPSERKKSCLSSANPRKEVPPHPALRRKTVAFGRTVNVSQTVEGTSRNSKKAMSSSATSSPAQKMSDEQKEYLRDVMKSELAEVQKELQREISEKMQEETKKHQEELNRQNIDRLEKFMSKLMQNSKTPAIEENKTRGREKENYYEPPRQHRPKPSSKIAKARETMRRDGIIPAEAIPILEERFRSDPMFRQQIDNVLADAECDANRAEYSPPPPLSETRYGNSSGGNPALMRETVTVERSIRCGNGLYSVDSRQWTAERGHDNYRPYEPDPPFHSTYQQGQSISYYPSELAQTRRHHNGYIVEDSSDQEEDVVMAGNGCNYELSASEAKAERERRVRAKWERKN